MNSIDLKFAENSLHLGQYQAAQDFAGPCLVVAEAIALKRHRGIALYLLGMPYLVNC